MNAIILLRSRNFRLDIIGNKIDIKITVQIWQKSLVFCSAFLFQIYLKSEKLTTLTDSIVVL